MVCLQHFEIGSVSTSGAFRTYVSVYACHNKVVYIFFSKQISFFFKHTHMLKPSKTTSSNKLFDYDCVTLYFLFWSSLSRGVGGPKDNSKYSVLLRNFGNLTALRNHNRIVLEEMSSWTALTMYPGIKTTF